MFPRLALCAFHGLSLEELRQLAEDPLDATGVLFDAQAIDRLERALGPGDTPRIRSGRFDRAVFLDHLDLAGLHCDGALSFAGATFQRGLSLAKASLMTDVDFRGVLCEQRLSLHASTVGGHLDLVDAQVDEVVLEDATLAGSSFVSLVTRKGWFAGATFREGTDFSYAAFSEYARFDGCEFRSSAVFEDTAFAGRVSFAAAKFRQEARFYRATFDEDASFSRAEFHQGAGFHGARFRGDFTAAGTWCGDDLLLFGTHFEVANGVGKMQVEGALRLSESRWDEHVGFDVRTPLFDCSKAEFRAGTDIITSDGVDLKQTSFGAASRVRAGVFWHMSGGRPGPILGKAEELPPRPRILSLRGADTANLVLSNVDLSRCRFAGANGLDALRFDGQVTFATSPASRRWTRRRTILEEHEWREDHGWDAWRVERPEADLYWREPTATEIATIYRALRKGQEDAKDTPGAADFYYGEMEMRRHARRRADATAATSSREPPEPRPRVETWLVWLYWLVSGYGLRSSRAIAALFVVVVACALWLDASGFTPDRSLPAAAVFALNSAISVGPTSLSRGLSTSGELTRVVLRILGPALIALAVLALRGRLKR